jgi:hypothetical protein
MACCWLRSGAYFILHCVFVRVVGPQRAATLRRSNLPRMCTRRKKGLPEETWRSVDREPNCIRTFSPLEGNSKSL